MVLDVKFVFKYRDCFSRASFGLVWYVVRFRAKQDERSETRAAPKVSRFPVVLCNKNVASQFGITDYIEYQAIRSLLLTSKTRIFDYPYSH